MSIAMQSVDPKSFGSRVEVPSPRLKHEGLTDTDRNFTMAMHLTPLLGLIVPFGVFTPLVLWLVRKDESVFADDHGREVVNFWISFVILHVVIGIISVFTMGLGLLLYPVYWVVTVVGMIRGTMAASNGEYFRYPMTIRLIQ